MKFLKQVRNLIFRTLNRGGRLSYAQSGEDMILQSIFYNVKTGFYIDVGANNPFLQSNTYYFYKKGWNGINIDAMPDSMRKFKKSRKRDINLELAISDNEEVLSYYMYSSSFYNSFIKADFEEGSTHPKLIDTKEIKTHKLCEILDKYTVDIIHFLSIDVEGLELNVLRSNDWIKYRPKIVIIEYFSKGFDLLQKSDAYDLLLSNGYLFYCNTTTNTFFIEKDFLNERFK